MDNNLLISFFVKCLWHFFKLTCLGIALDAITHLKKHHVDGIGINLCFQRIVGS